jgi:hypothetical protein
MTDLEQLIRDRWESRADQVPVGPVPVDAMVRAAGVRRRRPWVAVAAAAAVAIVVGGLAVVLPSVSPDDHPTPMPSPTATEPGEPDVQRVTIAHVTIDVPGSWPVGVSRCAGPLGDAVLRVDRWGGCRKEVGSGVELVEPIDVDPRRPRELTPLEIEVDGVPALRSGVVCLTSSVPQCSGWIWVPSEGAGFRVESRTGAHAVDELLDTVRVDPAVVAVPRPVPLSGVAFTLGMYQDVGEALGLDVVIPPGSADVVWEPGSTRVTPRIGTVVPAGSVVRVERR